MAFWNRKKEVVNNSYASSSEVPLTSEEIELINRLEHSVRLSMESRERTTAQLLRSNQDLCKALNSAARDFKKSK